MNFYTIESILKTYEKVINNHENAHNCEYFKNKSNLSIDEINLIILKRKALYYELKYPNDEFNIPPEHIEDTYTAINEYVSYVDERLKSKKYKDLYLRDLYIFYSGFLTDINPVMKLDECIDFHVKTDCVQPEIIDEKIQSLYCTVFKS